MKKIKNINRIIICMLCVCIVLFGGNVKCFADEGVSITISISESIINADGITYIKGAGEAIITVRSQYGIVGGTINVIKSGITNSEKYTYSGENKEVTESVYLGDDGDGEYTIECEFYDSENYSNCKSKQVFNDTESPVIDDIVSEGGISLIGSQAGDIQFTDGLTAIISGHDDGMGIDRIEYKLNDNGNIIEEGALDVVNDGGLYYKATLRINPGFNGIVIAKAYDKVNNDSIDVSTGVIYTDGKSDESDENDEQQGEQYSEQNENIDAMEDKNQDVESEDEKKYNDKSDNDEQLNENASKIEKAVKEKISKEDKCENDNDKKNAKKTDLVDSKNEKENNNEVKQRNSYSGVLKPGAIKIKGIKDGGIYNNTLLIEISINSDNLRKQDIEIEVKNNNNRWFANNLKKDKNKWIAKIDKNCLEMTNGLYELTVSIYDGDAHKKIKKVKRIFYINNGSEYMCDDEIREKLGEYLRRPCSFGITELNMDDKLEETVEIKLTKNGISGKLIENEDYSIEKKRADGVTQYHYVINEAVFDEDGIYSFIFSSVDNAGNRNISYDGKNGIDIYFGLDKLAPHIETINLESGMTVNSNKYLVKAIIHDNICIDDIRICINDHECEYDKDGDSYSFTINERNSFQDVKILARDRAGHETDLECQNVTVSTKLIIRIFHYIMLGLGYFMIIVGGIGLFVRKIRRTE